MQYIAALLAALLFASAIFLVSSAQRQTRRPSPTALARASMRSTLEGRLLWDAAVALTLASGSLSGEMKTRVDAIARIACRRAPLHDAVAAQLFAVMIEKATAEVIAGPAHAHLQSALNHAEALVTLMRAKTIQRAVEAPRVA